MDGLSAIYQPVHEELEAVKSLVKGHVIAMQEVRQYIEPYFNAKAKYMRPFLALSSAKILLKEKIANSAMNRLFDFAVAVELIHTASLVHDDIIDGELKRRGEVSLNIKYGPGEAVLLGDMLYSRALQILCKSFNPSVSWNLLEVINKMCYGQFMEKLENNMDKRGYLKMIRLKTGLLMGFSCTGVVYAATENINKAVIDNIFNFGVYSGMFYQMVDDSIDKDLNLTITDLASVKQMAVNEVKTLPPSIYKLKMVEFLDYILQYKTRQVQV
ncbi:MAG: polyprenyl synthetase family protein [Elusimicrobia bacterium]|nr:polyprenyl synthetase family protein [Candidatus Liberimonas magnetica]